MELRGQQPQALEAIRRWYEKPTPVFRLDGSAGVGKTTVAIKFSEFAHCHYMTLSGMAAQVLQRKGCHGASTIHSAIYHFDEHSQSWVVNRESFVADYDVLVVDESMFVYPQLGRDILSFGVPVIAMGDPNQLPPPNGEGSFFESFQQDYVMTEVLRQAEDSPVLGLAYRALSGEPLKPGKYGDSVVYSDKVKPSTVTDAMLAADQVLCGKNVTRRGVNREIRENLGLYGEQGKELPVVGDRLICLRNNHQKGILNGEQFLVREVQDRDLGEVIYMVVESIYSPGKLVEVAVPWAFFFGTEDNLDFYTKKSYDQFTYGYCVTVHKCLHPDTLVPTEQGLLPIKKLNDSGIVATGQGAERYVAKVVNAFQEFLEITTEFGYNIKCTKDHKLVTVIDGESLCVESQNLTVGSWLRLSKHSEVAPENYQTLPQPALGDSREVLHRTPVVCDEDVGLFLGLMVADGTVYKSGFRLLKRDKQVAEVFSQLLQKLFGIPGKQVGWNNAVGYEVNSTRLSKWLAKLGGMEPNRKYVPECIMRSPTKVKLAFMRGLFEDGSVALKNGLAESVELTSANPELIRYVQTFLLSVDIVGSVNTYANLTRINIYGKYVGLFKELIGFVSEKKNSKLHNHILTDIRTGIPVSNRLRSDLVRNYGMTYSESGNAKTGGRLSRTKAEKFQAHPEVAELLKSHWVRIVKIEPIASGESMCLTVPNGHKFVQQGFVGSNSQGSQWDNVVILDESKAFRESKKNHLYTAITRAAKNVKVFL